MTRSEVLWKKEVHTFVENGRPIVFDVVELNAWLMNSVEHDVLEAIDGQMPENTIAERLSDRYPADEVRAAIETWRMRGVLLDQKPSPASVQEDVPAVPTFMTLNVAQVCNLRCKYCFAIAGTYDGAGIMSQEVARAVVDMLMRRSGEEKRVSILFFGGEPLLNMEAVSCVIEYAREQAKAYGKSVGFFMITNGVKLTPQNVDYLVQQGVRIEISIDGPAEVHDLCRVFADGRGSYKQVEAGARALIERSRWPVAANATLTRHHPRLKEIVAHFESLGFVGSGIKLCELIEKQEDLFDMALTPEDIVALQEDIREYVHDLIAQDEFTPAFSNVLGFRQFVKQLANRQARIVNCGVGRYLISVSANGDVYPCYTLIGVKNYRLGNVLAGSLHFELLEDIRLASNVNERPSCQN